MAAVVTTTIKTEQCSFSELRIYPGRGIKSVAKDGKVAIYANSRMKRLHAQRVKPVRLRWTMAWRRANKKLAVKDTGTKRRTRKVAKVQRAVAGMTLEEMKKRADQTKAVPGTRAAALKEARAKTAAAQKGGPVGGGAARAANIPRNQPKNTSKVAAKFR